ERLDTPACDVVRLVLGLDLRLGEHALEERAVVEERLCAISGCLLFSHVHSPHHQNHGGRIPHSSPVSSSPMPSSFIRRSRAPSSPRRPWIFLRNFGRFPSGPLSAVSAFRSCISWRSSGTCSAMP